MSRCLCLFAFLAGLPCAASVGPVTFINDYQGFLEAAGDVRVIDFDTLPDGSPTTETTLYRITPEFNYTDQGVTFSAAVGELVIGGNSVSGFELIADAYLEQQRTWIIADLEPAANSVGVSFAGGVYLSIYDEQNDLLLRVFAADTGRGGFVGIVSDDPIYRATADKENIYSIILDFSFAPVPEPSTLILLLMGLIATARLRSSP